MPEEAGQQQSGQASENPPQGERTFTQTEVDRMVGVARREARTAFLGKFGLSTEDEFRSLLDEAETVRKSQMSDAEKLQAQLGAMQAEKEALEASLKAANLNGMRASIARSKGLPEPLIARVTGEDEESITTDVEDLLQFVKLEQESIGGGSNPPGAGNNLSPDERMANLLASAFTSKRTGG